MTDAFHDGFSDGGSDDKNSSRPPSVDFFEVGGRCYPMERRGSCATCTSPFRYDLEKEVLFGATYADVVGEFPDAQISEASFRRHFERKHVNLEGESVGRLRKAREEDIRQAQLIELGAETRELLALSSSQPLNADVLDAITSILSRFADISEDAKVFTQGFRRAGEPSILGGSQ